MADQNEQDTQKSEMRVMWIMSAVVVLIILGLMGFNMLTHPDWMPECEAEGIQEKSQARITGVH
jgi:hypothetical protein